MFGRVRKTALLSVGLRCGDMVMEMKGAMMQRGRVRKSKSVF